MTLTYRFDRLVISHGTHVYFVNILTRYIYCSWATRCKGLCFKTQTSLEADYNIEPRYQVSPTITIKTSSHIQHDVPLCTYSLPVLWRTHRSWYHAALYKFSLPSLKAYTFCLILSGLSSRKVQYPGWSERQWRPRNNKKGKRDGKCAQSVGSKSGTCVDALGDQRSNYLRWETGERAYIATTNSKRSLVILSCSPSRGS